MELVSTQTFNPLHNMAGGSFVEQIKTARGHFLCLAWLCFQHSSLINPFLGVINSQTGNLTTTRFFVRVDDRENDLNSLFPRKIMPMLDAVFLFLYVEYEKHGSCSFKPFGTACHRTSFPVAKTRQTMANYVNKKKMHSVRWSWEESFFCITDYIIWYMSFHTSA